MRKRLLIFSGSSDHTCDTQRNRYGVIIDYAISLGYKNQDIKIISYPGQFSNDAMKYELTFNSSVDTALKSICDYEEGKYPYDIVCLSYGCNVFMGVVEKKELSLSSRIVLWAPSPQVKFYEILIKNRDVSYKDAEEKYKVKYGEKLFSGLPSFEMQLSSYNQTKKLIIGCGMNDTVSTLSYHNYMAEQFKNDQRFVFKSIDNVGHSVSDKNIEYFKLLFKE